MGPIPITAVAVEWQFRCLRTDAHGHAWEWRCRSGEGDEIASSVRRFESLQDAIADAAAHGFGPAV